MPTATEDLSSLAFGLSKIVFEVTGNSLAYNAQTLQSSLVAKIQQYLIDVSDGHIPITPDVKATTLRYIDDLYRFSLEPLAGGHIKITEEFEKTSWGKLINSALSMLYHVNDLMPVKETTEALEVPRSTIQYWHEKGMLYTVTTGTRTYYIKEQVFRLKEARRVELASRARPGRRRDAVAS